MTQQPQISGQPSQQDLRAFAEAGGRVVINNRTTPEMVTMVPFDEPRAVEDLGLRYVHMPISGAGAMDDAAVTRLGELLDDAEGPVLLHCTTGTRCRVLYSALVAKRQGLTADQAVEVADRLGLGDRPDAREAIRALVAAQRTD